MPRLLGLAQASKLFRNVKELSSYKNLSNSGNEVAFGSIGDASTSEGPFWETINAAGVLQVPMAITIYDNGYGISVPKKFQTTKESISVVLAGFQRDKSGSGITIFKGKGWDYEGLLKMFEEGIELCRREQTPVVFHVEEVTQPLGHSTSGSHERYKDEKRLNWEKEYDPIKKMREWILLKKVATATELDALETETVEEVKEARKVGWKAFQDPIKVERDALIKLVTEKACKCEAGAKEDAVDDIISDLKKVMYPP